MTLGELIAALETANPQQIVKHGFHNPHSYRGDYYDLAFEPTTNITVADMLEAARSAVGATYQGWKGGDFNMTAGDWCWLSEQGSASGETISPLLLEFILTPPTAAPSAPTDRTALLHAAALAVQSGDVWFHTAAAEAALKNGGTFALIAYAQLAIAEHLRRMADEPSGPGGVASETQQDKTQAEGWHVTPETLDLFVRALVNEVDYDIHKNYLCGEEDGEDHYPELVAEAAAMLDTITAEQPSAVSQLAEEA
ncbi:hypothetical protein ACFV0T_26315 [Streptomyces sp. NPDC059582]|uniref:hypothetical protein n=1 Tax=Streptomyces sp. NPDC059582 TaxID=3346875 RepID=UPI0036948EB7